MARAAALGLREAPRSARVVRQVPFAPQGEHCQSCSSAVQPRRFCGAQALWRVEIYCGDARERFAAASRTRVAHKGGLKLGKRLEDPRVRRPEEGSRQRSTSALKIAPVPRTTFWTVGISKAREVQSRRSGCTRIVQAQRCTGSKEGSATVPVPRVCNNTQRFTKSSST